MGLLPFILIVIGSSFSSVSSSSASNGLSISIGEGFLEDLASQLVPEIISSFNIESIPIINVPTVKIFGSLHQIALSRVHIQMEAFKQEMLKISLMDSNEMKISIRNISFKMACRMNITSKALMVKVHHFAQLFFTLNKMNIDALIKLDQVQLLLHPDSWIPTVKITRVATKLDFDYQLRHATYMIHILNHWHSDIKASIQKEFNKFLHEFAKEKLLSVFKPDVKSLPNYYELPIKGDIGLIYTLAQKPQVLKGYLEINLKGEVVDLKKMELIQQWSAENNLTLV